MGCVAACFGSLRRSRKAKKHRPIRCKDHQSLTDANAIKEALLCANQSAEEAQIASFFDSAIKEKNEDKLNISARKKVTFDLNVKIPEECQQRKEEEGEASNVSVQNEGKGEMEEIKEMVVGQDIINSSGENGEDKAEIEQNKDEASDLVSDSSISSLFSYPHNFRYRNWPPSDDDSVDNMEFKDSNLANDEIDSDNNDKNGCKNTTMLVQEESSESLFSLSIDSRKQNSAADIDLGEKEVCSPFQPPFQGETNNPNADVQSVLSSIENLSQWKAVRTKTTAPMANQDKENIHLEQENATFAFSFSSEPSSKKSSQQRSRRFLNRRPKGGDEATVDTSLSSWLMGSEKAPTNENSPGSVGNSSSKSSSKTTNTPKSLENRPILGALTAEELEEMSRASSFPSATRSPSHSPDEIPIIGTVGSYWRNTATEAIDAADFGPSSMSILSKKISMESTPFQTRLERMQQDFATQV